MLFLEGKEYLGLESIVSQYGETIIFLTDRKILFFINVQTICDANLKIQDIVARRMDLLMIQQYSIIRLYVEGMKEQRCKTAVL